MSRCLRRLLSAANAGALRGDSEPRRLLPGVAGGHRAALAVCRPRAELQTGGESYNFFGWLGSETGVSEFTRDETRRYAFSQS